jgi:hypothetical protein
MDVRHAGPDCWSDSSVSWCSQQMPESLHHYDAERGPTAPGRVAILKNSPAAPPVFCCLHCQHLFVDPLLGVLRLPIPFNRSSH